MLFSFDHDLVLFRLDSVWVQGKRLSHERIARRLAAGATFSFYDQSIRGDLYNDASEDGVFNQV